MKILKKAIETTATNVVKFWKSNDPHNPQAISPSAMVVFVVLASLAALFLQKRSNIVTIPTTEPMATMDVNIPEGHLLVPIEIINYEAVDSIVGHFSSVDLFSSPLDPEERARRIAKKVKLYQPTKNINNFSILVTPEQASLILSTQGPYRATIRNPKAHGGTKIVKTKAKARSRVQYLSL